MTLHAAIEAALDREQAQAEAAMPTFPLDLVQGTFRYNSGDQPARTLRRIEADRRVLARHTPVYLDREPCDHCDNPCPCEDLLDLAARYDVEP